MIRILWLIGSLLALAPLSTLAQTSVAGSPACGSAEAAEAGETEMTLQAADLERRYLRYIPPSYDAETPLPVVLSLHGFAGTPQQQRNDSGFNELADAENFIVVYPRGTGFPLRWANGINEFVSEDSPIDVIFLRELVTHLGESVCIDPARVYISGFSAGGGMANRAACQLSDVFAAFGTVAGAYSEIPGGCEPERPVPMITLHGTGDSIVPYEGRGVTLPFIPDWVEGWALRNACAAEPQTIAIEDSVEALVYDECAGGVSVRFYTVEDGGHIWYGAPPNIFVPNETDATINASAVMWDFFAQYSLPSS